MECWSHGVMYSECRLCPRDCGVDRTSGALGVCGEDATCRVASHGPHFGEEPSFSSTRGSGTIFFTGCSSHCFFCQNHQILNEHMGRRVSPDELLGIARSLVAAGVHNLNFVTPDHFWPHIEFVCRTLRAEGVTLPFLFNSSGYQREDMVPRYAEVMDIFMPDFKFATPAIAKRCMGDEQYPAIALGALGRMVELRGFLDPWDPTGVRPAQRGVLVRHLIQPGEEENSIAVLRLLRKEFGPLIPLSVMNQFHPVAACRKRGELTRRISAGEHERVRSEVLDLGFKHVYMQAMPETADFLPDFSQDEPFQGNRR